MNNIKITFTNRNHTDWILSNSETHNQIHIDNFNPCEYKIFSNDIFSFENNTLSITHSTIRNCDNIPAVLVLENNKTFGSYKNKHLYKCIPDDTRLPIFLVPYEIKHLGFSKHLINIYVTIKYDSWNDKHPRAYIMQNIGNVDTPANFYEYQLYCKSLNSSIQKFNKDVNKLLRDTNYDNIVNNILNDSKYKVEDRTHICAFSIDPMSSLDYDDAFSIETISENKTKISIYIANVTILIDTLSLWASFSHRVATIYLPDRKRPMLPTLLSDKLSSLQAGTKRFAFVMDIIIEDNTICDLIYSNCVVSIYKNFTYESNDLLNFDKYKQLFTTSKTLFKKYKYMQKLEDSHDVVAYLMTLMNHYCALDLKTYNNGIFRSTTEIEEANLIDKNNIPQDIPHDVIHFIHSWQNTCGQYINIENMEDKNIPHKLLGLDAYTHITSPIRRLVDILNLIKFQKNHNLFLLSEHSTTFYNDWIGKLDYINTSMRSIRKIQNTCSLLHECTTNTNILEQQYDGYCFDKISRNDGLFQYNIYLPQLKIASKLVSRENIPNFNKSLYKLCLFTNEETLKKKIRLCKL